MILMIHFVGFQSKVSTTNRNNKKNKHKYISSFSLSLSSLSVGDRFKIDSSRSSTSITFLHFADDLREKKWIKKVQFPQRDTLLRTTNTTHK